MEKRLTTVLASLVLCAGSAMAQVQVTGTVTSQDDGSPIVGASVVVNGSNVGAITNINGQFKMTVPKLGTKLTVKYLGMQPTTVAAKDHMKIALVADDKTLNEVVVTAMGLKREAKSLGYSATSVKGEDMVRNRTNDVMSSLAGKVAGVQISSSSGDPGGSKSVIIRGISSLSGNNQPLYVIDGVPLTNTAVYSTDGLNKGYDFGNGASAVNPEDVENMTILKGAAATALYGSRAANGVILITTKKGSKQKGIGIEYNGGLQWEQVMRLPQMQNSFGQGWYGNKTMIENGSWGPLFDGSYLRYGTVYNNSQQRKSYVPIPNNLKDFYDTGFRYNNNVAFNGATDKTTYYVSLSQIQDDGIIPTQADRYRKYTFSARGSQKVKNVTISTALNYAYQHNNFVTTGQGKDNVSNDIAQVPRDISIVEYKNLEDPFHSPGYYFTPYGVTNPYYVLENYKNEFESERFYGKFQLDYDFLKYFKMTYRFGLDTSSEDHNMGAPNMSVLFKDTPNWEDCLKSLTGYTYEKMTRRREINQDLMVTFDKEMPSDFHVNALLGFNGNERGYRYEEAKVTNLTIPTYFNLSNSAEKPEVKQYRMLRRLMGAYGQAEISWRNMAYLTMTARNDWSSTLPKGNRSFFYPGFTGSFLFSELLNKSARKVITFGKVRAAWGKTGNDANVYMTNSVYQQASANTSGWEKSKFPFTKSNANAYSEGNVLGSSTLSPEMTTEFELGLNMAFFQNRLSFDASYYNRNSDKQIFSLNMDPATGYTAQNINLGKVRNRGIEALVTVVPVRSHGFEWSLSWNFTKNSNKVIHLPEELGGQASIYGFTGGTGLYAVEGMEMGVFKAYVPKRTEDGKYIVDNKGLLVQGDQEYVGSINYKYQMGFNNSLSYKGVSLTFDIDVRKGGKMFSRTKNINLFTGNGIETIYNDRNPWIIPNSVIVAGKNADGTPIYAPNETALNETNIYDFWDKGGMGLGAGQLIDKSYVKLRSVVLSWQLPKKWLSKTFLTGASVSLFGNNLFVWTPKENSYIDPEASSFGNDLEGSFGEYSSNPSSRKMGFNINVKF